MKKVMFYMMLLASFTLTTGCSQDDDDTEEAWDETQTQQGQTSSSLDDNNVTVEWNGEDATVAIASNLSGLVTATIKGGHVCILADSSLEEEVTYTLSGTSSNGSLYMDGDYKVTFVLDGLTLASNRTDSAAINIRDGKRIAIVLNEGTTNTLSDRAGGSHKACMMVNGHTEFQGSGSLTLTGNTQHAFWGDEYVLLKKTTGSITVKEAETDGFNVNQYFQMNGGTLTIANVGDDGIAVAATDDTSDELNGQVIVKGGTLNISVSGNDSKGIKCEAEMTVEGGTITVQNTGTDGKGIKSEGAMTISDGTVTATARYHEAIESKSTLDITGGTVTAISNSDDAINAGSHFTISGGYVIGYSTGNDGLDANGNFYMKGGTVYAIGASQPEVAIDANSEQGYKVYVSGGNLVAIGGLESGSSLSQTCYQASSWNKNTWYALYNGSSLSLCFKSPSSGGNGLVVSTSGTTALASGVSVGSGTEIFNGMGCIDGSVSGGTSVSLSAYSGGSSMGGGGFGPGGRW